MNEELWPYVWHVSGIWIAGAIYISAVVLVRSTHKSATKATFTRLADDGELPDTVAALFKDTITRLSECGFSATDFLFSNDIANDINTHIAVMRNSQTHEIALAVASTSTNNVIQNNYVEISSEFSDGFILDTQNSQLANVFKPDPNHPNFRLPSISDPAKLHQVHTALVKRFAATRHAVLPKENIIAFLQASCEKEGKQAVEVGYFYVADKGTCFRPTWFGAAIMTCRCMPPISSIRSFMEKRRNAALLREMALDSTGLEAAS